MVRPLLVVPFGGPDDPLEQLKSCDQARYILCYLADLNARSALVEPTYFDRDYLSEFASFYCTSTAGYPNVCKRVHYFSTEIDRELLTDACSGVSQAQKLLNAHYLGFVVLRPIQGTPLGRTVLRWYGDKTPHLPRVDTPSRNYEAHIAGFSLQVRGLAWQQQDSGVGACATIALWSMLHSSAFDDRHVIPTTAEITQTAHRAGLTGDRLFPSEGLTFGQLVAAVRDSGFAPLVVTGKVQCGHETSFSREHFCSSLAALVRSGFPVLIAGTLTETGGALVGGHAVCATGFRQAGAVDESVGQLSFEDENTEYVYLHDDNIGPSVRFRIDVETRSEGEVVILRPSRPPPQHAPARNDPVADYPCLRPSSLLAAAHEEIRISPDRLHERALHLGTMLIAMTGGQIGLSASARFFNLRHFVGAELGRLLDHHPQALAKVRLALWEEVHPMSLHLGVIRIGYKGTPLMDVLFDTTDSEPNTRAFAHLVYESAMEGLLDGLVAQRPDADRLLGPRVLATS